MRRTRKQQTVVIDFGRGAIRMALAESAGEAVRFRGITQVDLPQRPDDPEGSRLSVEELDPDTIAAYLAEEVERNGWRGLPAACLLSGSATSTQSFLFPPMPAEDLERAIGLKLRETLHFDLEDACLDHRRLSRQGAEDDAPALTLVAAARVQSVQQAVAVLRQAGLRPVRIGAAAESLANLSQCTSLWDSDLATIHVDIGADSAILNLFEGTRLRFSRELEIGGEAFTRALMRPILTADGPIQLTYEQAEELRMDHGFPLERDATPLPHGIMPADIRPLVEPVAERIAGEIGRSIDYLRGLLDRPGVDSVVLSGSAGTMRNLDTFLEQTLNTPVQISDPVARAMFHWRLAVCDEQHPDLAGFAGILGYSLGNHRPINLLPREDRLEQWVTRLTSVRRVAVPAVGALGACLLLAGVPISRTYDRAGDDLRHDTAKVEARIVQKQAEAAARDALSNELARVEAARGLVPDWVGVMKELSVIVPAEVQVTRLDADCSSGVPRLTLHAMIRPGGRSFAALTTELSVALSTSPYFENVRVLEASIEQGAEHGDFEATLAIACGKAAPR